MFKIFYQNTIFISFFFVISGVLQPILAEILTYNGAFDKSTLLLVLPNCIGMSFAILTNLDGLKTIKYIKWREMSALALYDVISQALCMIGLVYAGSSIYIVIYSSTTVFAAMWSKLILLKTLNNQQWIGICIMVFGLGITALEDLEGGSSIFTPANITIHHDDLIGICCVLIGASIHALTWILIEKYTQSYTSTNNNTDISNSNYNSNHNSNSNNAKHHSIEIDNEMQELHNNNIEQGNNNDHNDDNYESDEHNEHIGKMKAPVPELICSVMGWYGCIIYGTWQVLYTLPHYNEVVLEPIWNKNGNIQQIKWIFCILTFVCFIHAITFYSLLQRLGAVTTGVMKGIQTISVFLISHVAFCKYQESQCFTKFRGVSLIIVLIGISYYINSSRKLKLLKISNSNTIYNNSNNSNNCNNCNNSNIIYNSGIEVNKLNSSSDDSNASDISDISDRSDNRMLPKDVCV